MRDRSATCDSVLLMEPVRPLLSSSSWLDPFWMAPLTWAISLSFRKWRAHLCDLSCLQMMPSRCELDRGATWLEHDLVLEPWAGFGSNHGWRWSQTKDQESQVSPEAITKNWNCFLFLLKGKQFSGNFEEINFITAFHPVSTSSRTHCFCLYFFFSNRPRRKDFWPELVIVVSVCLSVWVCWSWQ